MSSSGQPAAAGLALALALAAASQASAATNLISDGGFESPATPAGGFTVYQGGQTFGGWDVLGPLRGGAVQTLSNTYVEPNIAFDANSGDASMDLSGPGNVGPTAGIFQMVDTVKGQTYHLDFFVGNADGSHNGNYTRASVVDVQIGDDINLTFANSATTFERTNWSERGVTFTGTGGPTRIAFFNATPRDDAFTGLDDVSLTAVGGAPEPTTWSVLIAGFGIAGTVLRRQARSIRAR
jgi:hypothetical protein